MTSPGRSAPKPSLRPPSIAIVTHGRFHAFHLCRALLRQGCQATLFTDYPKWAVRLFGVPGKYVVSYGLHKTAERFRTALLGRPAAKNGFTRWALRHLARRDFDVLYVLINAAPGIFPHLPRRKELRLIDHTLVHLRTLRRLMAEERKRAGLPDPPVDKQLLNRVEQIYAAADAILVLSSYAKSTFEMEGFPPERLKLLLLGVDSRLFRPSPAVVEARCRRILSGNPLRVLTVGTFQIRKGILDLAEIASRGKNRFHFRFVGHVDKEAKSWAQKSRGLIEFLPRKLEWKLPSAYAWGDVFLFPTLMDGYPVVLAQAQASALPILATKNCSAPDILREGGNGWLFPIRSPQDFLRRLDWCNEHRVELAQMVRRIAGEPVRDWEDVARDLLATVEECRNRFTGARNTVSTP